MNKVVKLFRKTTNLLTKDKAKTLTCANAVGVVVVAGVSFKSGMNVQKKIDNGELKKTDIIKNVAPVVAAVAVTEVAGIKSYTTSAKTIADLTIGLNSVRHEYDVLEKKIKESVGDEKAADIKKEADKEVAKDSVENTFELTGYGWFKDEFTTAFFYTTEENLYFAWTKIVRRLVSGDKVTIHDYYWEIERKSCFNTESIMTKAFGWDGSGGVGSRTLVRIEGTDLLPDEKTPCRVIKYSNKPIIVDENPL